MGDDRASLSAKFISVSSGVPLADKPYIAIGHNPHLSPLHVANRGAEIATNLRHVLETGQSAIYTGLLIGESATVDWSADDAYTRAVDAAVERVRERIAADGPMQELLAQSEWSQDDRRAWERRLSGFVSEEVDKIPGFHEYRSSMGRYRVVAPEDDGGDRLLQNIDRDPLEKAYRRTYRLNDLSPDIEGGTIESEYDCDIMSMTEGAVLQRVEDATLPREPEVPDSMKYAASYFVAGGEVTYLDAGIDNAYGGYHAYIVSSATGAAIESTYDPSHADTRDPYITPQPGYGFEEFVAGVPLLILTRLCIMSAPCQWKLGTIYYRRP